jgi:hypothetical protein
MGERPRQHCLVAVTTLDPCCSCTLPVIGHRRHGLLRGAHHPKLQIHAIDWRAKVSCRAK